MICMESLNDIDILNKELYNTKSVFIDEAKLSADFIPENLLFRTDHLRFLVNHFRGLFSQSNMNRGLLLTGAIGSGKTSISKKFGAWAVNSGLKKRLEIKYIHINCRVNKTPFMIWLDIVKSLNSYIPNRGYSANELMNFVREIIVSKKYKLLITLDEIDFCSLDDISDLLYGLTRINDGINNFNHSISLILISRSSDYIKHIDASTKSSLTTANLHLEQYKKIELIGIIKDRAKIALNYNALSNEAIILAAEITAKKGDARQALELIWYAGKSADNEQSDTIFPEHIREAKSNIDPSLLRQTISDLSHSKLLLLVAIARSLIKTKKAYATTGEVKNEYLMTCEEFESIARKHTQMWEYLKEFEKYGIIFLKISGKKIRGNTQLISIQDVSAKDLERAVLRKLQS
jgi:cell division control protein 6